MVKFRYSLVSIQKSNSGLHVSRRFYLGALIFFNKSRNSYLLMSKEYNGHRIVQDLGCFDKARS